MEIAAGQIIAEKYKIEKKIGEGATGIVYLVKDQVLSKYAAVKFLRREYSSNVAQRKRFLNEARVASQFVHESVVAIREVNEWRGHLYIIMDYHDGRTLKEVMQEKILSKEEVFQITKQLLDCLNAAHEKNILHRDIKPSNLMINVEKNGSYKLKILDFGLASCGENQSTISGGTLHYVSPEQLLDDPTDHRSDLYSAAVCIYEMYSGVLPIYGNTPQEFVYNLLNGNTSSRLQPKRIMFPPLQKVLFKALATEPETRYRDVQQFWKALQSNLKFPYYEILRKSCMLIAALFILWLLSVAWNYQKQNNLREQYLGEAWQHYEEKEYQKAIDLAKKSQNISLSYESYKVISESHFAQWQQEKAKESSDPKTDLKELHYLIQEYQNFQQSSLQINEFAKSENYENAIALIEKYKGLKTHQEIFAKQQQRLQLEFYRTNLKNAIHGKKSQESLKWYNLLKDKISNEEKEIWLKKMSLLEKQDDYEEAMYMGEYSKAMKIAKSFQFTPLWQNRYNNAQDMLHKQLQSCIIVSPIQGKVINRRIVLVQVHITSDVMAEYLKVNNMALNYTGNIWEVELVLPSDVQKIFLTYEQNEYKYVIQEIQVHIDITPPIITIEKSFIDHKEKELIIVGSAAEDSRMDTIYFENSEAQPLNAAFSKWQLSIPLTKTSEQIQIIARDIAGNTSYYKYSLTLDSTPPQIYIESPLASEKVYNNEVAVTGIVIDDSKIEQIKVMSTVVPTESIKNGKWTVKLKILPEWIDKENKILLTIEATDIWGNVKQENIVVIAEYLQWNDLSIKKKLAASKEKIWGLCYSPDGKYLVSAANDGRKTVWDTGTYESVFVDSISPITSKHLKISPAIRFNASLFAKVTSTGTKDFFNHNEVGGSWRVNYSDLKDRELGDIVQFFDYHISCIALSPDGLYLAMGHHSGNLRIIDLQKNRYILHSNIHNGVILCLSYSADSKWLASGGGDYKIKILPVNTLYHKNFREKHTLSGHTMSITTLAFANKSSILASGSQDKSVRLWDIEEGKQISKLSGHTSRVECISFSPVAKVLCTTSSSGEMFIWK